MNIVLRIIAWILAAAVAFATLGPATYRPQSELSQNGEHALAFILVGKLFRKPVADAYSHRYRLWLNRSDVRRQVSLLRRVRGRNLTLEELTRIESILASDPDAEIAAMANRLRQQTSLLRNRQLHLKER